MAFSLVILTALFFFATPLKTRALGENFDLSLFPNYPKPGSAASAVVSSLNFEVEKSAIIWTVNGKVKRKGTGEKTLNFTMPDFGKTIKIGVEIITPDKENIAKSVSITGNDLDLIWQADTYIPYWYKANSLAVVESFVNFAAIPHLFLNNTLLQRDKLFYEWFFDYEKQSGASGIGKNSFKAQIKNFDDHTVTVKVSDLGRKTLIEKSAVISASKTNPEIIFYEIEPLAGVVFGSSAPSETNLESEEIILKAEPFFFSLDKTSDYSYEWEMNGKKINPEGEHGTIHLKKNPGISGTAFIKLSVQNLKKIFQSAEKTIKINF
ncbi:MAG: hypothetical protein PHC85_03165 [Candidatus Pacebacteria bacterium]|nr:hypothetical protein [Candidatus Paceibacterota bacterium]